MRPSQTPTLADLFLAFRQAKIALYFERRGVGLLELAAYESDLPNNLKVLQKKLKNGGWFENLEIGETWIVPKRLRASQDPDDGVVRIGSPQQNAVGRPVDIQLRLSPHPEFATVEVLFLWRFGGLLDTMLSEEVLGYRLDLRGQRVVPHRRWLFEYWPPRYMQFRTAPLDAAKNALKQGEQTLIISGDLASFYDTVEPSFLLAEQVVDELCARDAQPAEIDEYKRATASLLRAYQRFHAEASRRVAIPITIGVPIGALTSRIVANLSLASLDSHVITRPGILCYRRYVDDLVIVAKVEHAECGLVENLRRFLPLLVEDTNDVLRLDVDALGRIGSEFQLQKAKVRIHHLAGIPGSDFVDAVASDFEKAVSERRAFIDSATLVGDGVAHLVRAGETEGSPLRVLRDADRARLERFALSTSLHSLERVSSLIDQEHARKLVRGSLERVGRVLDAEDNWVSDLDVSLRLLKLSIFVGDLISATELVERMDRVWGTVDALRDATKNLYYRDRKVGEHKAIPWTWLRNYLHERRLEAVVSAFPIGMDSRQVDSRIFGGLLLRTRRVGKIMLRRRAELLVSADLRSRDREDDELFNTQENYVDREWLRAEVMDDPELTQRLATIDSFVERCKSLGDLPWYMPAARLFLCTRPPSYFDIARRWLYRVESEGFAFDVFDRLLDIVNAVRGTAYQDAVGKVLDINTNTVSIESLWAEKAPTGTSSSLDPRIVLGNLVVGNNAWEAAATRISHAPYNAPMLTLDRFQGVARVIEKATRVARGRIPAVLVLPELSLPRRWFRTVSNHVVRLGRFGLVAGLEYLHDHHHQYVRNQVFAVLPGPFSSAATWPWTKRLPAREEGVQLGKLRPPVSFPPLPGRSVNRTVVISPWGAMSVLICSELLESRRVADLLGRVNVVLCPAWNTDTSSYDHLIQSVGFQLHSIIAIANNGHYSDCRAWAPRSKRWERDLCRLIERDVDDVVHVNIPLASLVAFHRGKEDENWRPLPPCWP